jgi:hypothetical protein
MKVLEAAMMAVMLTAGARSCANVEVYVPNAAAIFEKARIEDESILYAQSFEGDAPVTPMELYYVGPTAAKGTVVSQGVDRGIGFEGSKASYRVDLSFEPGGSGAMYLRFPLSMPVWSDMKLQWRIKAESNPKIRLGYRHGFTSGVAGVTDGNSVYGVKVGDADKDGWELWQASFACGKTNPAEYISGVSLYIETDPIASPTKAVIHVDNIEIVGRLYSGWEDEWKRVFTYYTVYAEKEQRAGAEKRLADIRSWSESLAKRHSAVQRPAGASPMLLTQYNGAVANVATALTAAKPLVEAVEAGLKSDAPFTAHVHAAELQLMDARYWLDVAESCLPYVDQQKDASVITYTLDPTQSYEILPLGPKAHLDEQSYNGWDEVAGYYENPAILPDSKPVPARAGTRLENLGARGLYVPFSFAVSAEKKLENLAFELRELYSEQHKLAATADLRVVAPVYMPIGGGKEPKLRNVMLVHDPDFVQAVGKADGYNKFKNPKMPDDAARMQPITIEAGQTRQFYMLIKVPEDAIAGTYEGTISGIAAGKTQFTLIVKLEVVPFTLEPTPFAYGAFNESFVAEADVVRSQGIGFDRKTFEQIEHDFLSQAEHGFNTLNLKNGYVPKSNADRRDRTPLRAGQSWDFTEFDRMLDAAVKAGLTRSPFSWESSHGVHLQTDSRDYYPHTQEQVDEWIDGFIPALVAHCKGRGYPVPALFGADEFTGERLKAMKPAYEAVKKAGGLVTCACYPDFFSILGPDLIQPMLMGGVTDAVTEGIVRAVQAKGRQVWIYNCPASNVLGAPASMRRRYGLSMWRNGEDGLCNWAYDDIGTGYADMARRERPVYCYAFPTWSGKPIDTPLYEALREGIYDTRYVATLEKALYTARKSGRSSELVKQIDGWLKSFSVNEDLGAVRRTMADYIIRLTQGERSGM